MSKKQILDEIKGCEEQLIKLRELANNLEKDTDFMNMSYSELMNAYFENEQFYDVRSAEEKNLRNEWKKAYSVFREQRDDRDIEIYKVVSNNLKRLINGNPNTDIYVIPMTVLVDLVSDEVKKLFETLTPFDCTDKKFTSDYYVEKSWENRIKLCVSKHSKDYLAKTYKGRRVLTENVIDLRK